MDTYNLEICGLKRELPLVYVGKNTRLASFSLLGDVELVSLVAEEIVKKLKETSFDYFIGPEVKVVPLIYELARRFGHSRFAICRKSIKPNMISPVIVKPLPFFPKHVRQLVLDGTDAEMLKGKKVVVVDDVISTGVTMRMMGELAKRVGAQVVATVAVLKQGKQFDKLDNILTLAELPIFKVD